jgi:hypothetical protein
VRSSSAAAIAPSAPSASRTSTQSCPFGPNSRIVSPGFTPRAAKAPARASARVPIAA